MLPPDQNRLLIVDDSDDDHFLFCAILRRAKIMNPVDHVSSGEDAMHYLEGCLSTLKPWPSVVFLDIRMPVMGGFEVLKWARAQGIGGRTVLAMMSTSAEAKDIQNAFILGAHSYVSKTGKPDLLIELVRTASTFASPAEAALSLPRFQPVYTNPSFDYRP